MIIDGITLPGPVAVQVDGHYLGTAHATPTGIWLHRRNRYTDSGIGYKQKQYLIRVTFVDLSPAELAIVVSAHAAALTDYVLLSHPGLGIHLPPPLGGGGGVTDDTCYVTVAPGTRLTEQGEQAWQASGAGPILYSVELSLLTADAQFMYGV